MIVGQPGNADSTSTGGEPISVRFRAPHYRDGGRCSSGGRFFMAAWLILGLPAHFLPTDAGGAYKPCTGGLFNVGTD
jgi:hypothetical protein